MTLKTKIVLKSLSKVDQLGSMPNLKFLTFLNKNQNKTCLQGSEKQNLPAFPLEFKCNICVLLHALLLVFEETHCRHTGERPPQCDQRSNAFAHFSDLRIHIAGYEITQRAIQVILKLSRWKKSYVTFFGFHNIQFNCVEFTRCVFSKYASLFNVLSQMLHWIVHLFLSMCSFKFPAVVTTAGHLSHLCAFLSPTHFVT